MTVLIDGRNVAKLKKAELRDLVIDLAIERDFFAAHVPHGVIYAKPGRPPAMAPKPLPPVLA